MSHYRKIDTRVWNDKKFNELTDDGKLVFFLLLTHPYLTSLGAMRASLPGLACDLKWSSERFGRAFDESNHKKMVFYDETFSFIWLPNFLKYNRPESPNVVKSWIKSLDYLPECSFKKNLIKNVESFIETLPESFQEALPKAFRKNMPYQEQEHKHKQEQEKYIPSGKPDGDISVSHIKIFKQQAFEVLNFLNKKAGKAYRPVDSNLNLIIARLKSGVSVDDCRQIIAKKVRKWKGDPKMDDCLRPATLFKPDNFEQYLGEIVDPVEGENKNEIN